MFPPCCGIDKESFNPLWSIIVPINVKSVSAQVQRIPSKTQMWLDAENVGTEYCIRKGQIELYSMRHDDIGFQVPYGFIFDMSCKDVQIVHL